jgi:hypothetical protein
MSRPRKAPAVLVDAAIRDNPKMAALPSDSARLGHLYVNLGSAKLQATPGLFASRGHYREVGGRFARFLSDYLAAGLLEEAPGLCERCRRRWSRLPVGALIVHDWHDHQYDPRRLERQWKYDERQRLQSDALSDGVSDALSDGVSDGLRGVSDGVLTAISRARAS